jgi:hypothetical protein
METVSEYEAGKRVFQLDNAHEVRLGANGRLEKLR